MTPDAESHDAVVLTSRTWRVRGHIGALGPASRLRAAYEAGHPVTLSGRFAGERVYLGHRRHVMDASGVTTETVGLDHTCGDSAVYLIDFTRLDKAPRLACWIAKADAAAEAAVSTVDWETYRHMRRYE